MSLKARESAKAFFNENAALIRFAALLTQLHREGVASRARARPETVHGSTASVAATGVRASATSARSATARIHRSSSGGGLIAAERGHKFRDGTLGDIAIDAVTFTGRHFVVPLH